MEALEVDNGVNITCTASGLFPEPKLSLFRITQSNDSNINVIEVKDKTSLAMSRLPSGEYSVWLTAHIYEDSYLDSTIDVTDHYECRLIIEKTDYMETKNLAIQSGMSHSNIHNVEQNMLSMAKLSQSVNDSKPMNSYEFI